MYIPSINYNGGPIDSSASVGAYIALCFGDPGAWILAIATLLYPTVRYLFGVKLKKKTSFLLILKLKKNLLSKKLYFLFSPSL